MATTTGCACRRAIAPKQVVIVPMLRDKPEDADVLAFCEKLASRIRRRSRVFGAPLRVHRRQERDPLRQQALGLGASRRADHCSKSARATRPATP